MNGSRTILVLKRDGGTEAFESMKLAGALWRAMRDTRRPARYSEAFDLAEAIAIFLRRTKRICVSSGVLFEMALKVLRKAGQQQAADELETHHVWRNVRRKQLRVVYDDGRSACWDKNWLAEMACRSWNLSPTTGRILAGAIENELLDEACSTLNRSCIVDRLNAQVAQWGLADAVPVDHPTVNP